MKAKQLAELLMANPELEVFVNGYEFGIERINEKSLLVVPVILHLNDWKPEYGGRHEYEPQETVILKEDYPGRTVINGLLISRGFCDE